MSMSSTPLLHLKLRVFLFLGLRWRCLLEAAGVRTPSFVGLALGLKGSVPWPHHRYILHAGNELKKKKKSNSEFRTWSAVPLSLPLPYIERQFSACCLLECWVNIVIAKHTSHMTVYKFSYRYRPQKPNLQHTPSIWVLLIDCSPLTFKNCWPH